MVNLIESIIQTANFILKNTDNHTWVIIASPKFLKFGKNEKMAFLIW